MGLCRDLLSAFRIPATQLQRFAPVCNRMQRLAERQEIASYARIAAVSSFATMGIRT
jgi:hypothetical protein